MRMLVAIDGSETSEAAVDEIAQRNLPPNSELRVISVIETAYSAASYSGGALLIFNFRTRKEGPSQHNKFDDAIRDCTSRRSSQVRTAPRGS